MEFRAYSCEPFVEEESIRCGYVPPNETEKAESTRPVPVLTGKTRPYLLTNGRVVFGLPVQVYQK